MVSQNRILYKKPKWRVCVYVCVSQTSPPSAREAAMSAIQHETFLKHLESFLETSLKHSTNTPENHETSSKHP